MIVSYHIYLPKKAGQRHHCTSSNVKQKHYARGHQHLTLMSKNCYLALCSALLQLRPTPLWHGQGLHHMTGLVSTTDVVTNTDMVKIADVVTITALTWSGSSLITPILFTYLLTSRQIFLWLSAFSKGLKLIFLWCFTLHQVLKISQQKAPMPHHIKNFFTFLTSLQLALHI